MAVAVAEVGVEAVVGVMAVVCRKWEWGLLGVVMIMAPASFLRRD